MTYKAPRADATAVPAVHTAVRVHVDVGSTDMVGPLTDAVPS